MPSVVPGYEYDIFISYRHNDNRPSSDYGLQARSGWVTEFVHHLNEELASTIKEPVSVYFDSNPHDGLHETHDVDESLKEKLKCVIFVPIISQTYCDPKSFAWNNEFLPFKKLASGDSLGLKIKLQSGNVARRILPVRIHELDENDRTTLEREIGPLRAIDFIFKTPGVNRPLRAHEEHPHDNLAKIFYRDQVNKVANAVKEILAPANSQNSDSQFSISELPKSKRVFLTQKKMAIGAIGTLALALVFFYFQNPFGEHSLPNEKSVAVLAFRNLSGDPNQEYFSDGISDELISKLTNVAELSVTPRATTFAFKQKDLSAKDMAQEMNVKYILDGSVRRHKDSVRVSVALIDGANGVNKWTETYSLPVENIFKIQSEIALNVIRALEVELVLEKKNAIENLPTKSKEAYDLFLKGIDYANKGTIKDTQIAINYYFKALELDPDFRDAKRNIAASYLLRVNRDGYGRKWADSALTIANQLIQEEPNEWPNYELKGWALAQKGKIKDAIKAYEASANHATDLNVFRRINAQLANVYGMQGRMEDSFYLMLAHWRNTKNVWPALNMGEILSSAGEPDLAKKFIRFAIKKDPSNTSAQVIMINAVAAANDLPRAIQLLDSIKILHGESVTVQGLLGYAELIKKNYRAAEGYYVKFIAAFPDAEIGTLPFRTHLGKVYKELSRSEKDDFFDAAKKSEMYLRESFSRDSLRMAAGDESYSIPYNFSLIHFVRGDQAKGYFWLRKSIEAGFREYPLLLIEPIFEKYRQDDEFKIILADIKTKLQQGKMNIEKHYRMPIHRIPGISPETFNTPMYAGHGYQFDAKPGYRIVTKVLPNSPAEESGLRAADKIIAAAKGRASNFLTADSLATGAFMQLTQTEGAQIKFKVKRDGVKDPFVVTITSRLFVVEE